MLTGLFIHFCWNLELGVPIACHWREPMRILFFIVAVLIAWPSPLLATCPKTKVCSLMKTMGHFDILNLCPDAGPLLAECKKVSEKKLEVLPAPQFIDNKDGTITDTVNKLIWAKKGHLKKYSLKRAMDYAVGADIEGNSGWRLPTLPEIKTLMYKERVKNVSGKKSWIHPLFDDGRGHYYWSTTTCEEVSVITDRYQKKLCQQGDQGAWLVHFNIGAVFWHHVTAEKYYAWLVKEAK